MPEVEVEVGQRKGHKLQLQGFGLVCDGRLYRPAVTICTAERNALLRSRTKMKIWDHMYLS